MLHPAEHKSRAIPLNAASNGRGLSEICSIFGRSVSEHPQSATWIDRIDRNFLFGNTRLPLLARGLTPSPRNWGPLR